ncbi:MAG: 50S ribosomal protein L24 [Acidimicrobiales bacterium]|jgi:large subunit ribosomal protein L24|nr:50S ribosomal protein L24 [Acidimicrobiales bacterium]
MKIRKGDRVQVLSGKDRGKVGDVMFAFPAEGKVIVDGVNVAKRHTKPRSATQPGGIIDKDMPIDVSNVAVVCDSCGKPTRVGYRFEPDGTKVRVCRKCEADLR